MRLMEALLNALRFLTIIPVPGPVNTRPVNAGRSLIFFPVVGLLIGLIAAGLDRLVTRWFPAPVTGALIIALTIVLTGGLHLDGLMDTVDGIFVRQTPEERLLIMDDSRVGAFGVTAAVLDILIRYSVLSGLPEGKLTEVWLLPPVVGRYLMTWSLFAFPAARKAGLGWLFKQGASLRVFAGTTGLAMVLIYSIAGSSGLIITASTWVIITIGGLYCKARLGGLTGDTCGALNEMAELSVLLIYSSLYHYPVGS